MRRIGEYEYHVQAMDIGFRKAIRFVHLGNYMLHAAGENAEENGFGIEVMHGEDLAWVLSRFAVEMERYPVQGEKFVVETWIEDFGRLFTTRNFKLKNAEGEILGGGSCIWCMINMTTRKAVDLGLKKEYQDFATGVPSIVAKPAKVAPLSSEPVSRHRIKYSDIDFNRHTNSMKYLEWMLDLFPMEGYSNQQVRRMDINFINEALFGEVVDIRKESLGDKLFAFDLRRGDDPICRARILFENVS